MEYKIAPTLLNADYSNLSETFKIFEKNKIDFIHIDVMDGEFVPNISLGTGFCQQVRKMTDIPLDIHLMINRPDLKLGWFNFQEGEFVSVHYESTPHIQRTLKMIKDFGAKPVIALCPATPVNVLDYVADVIDGVLIMTVNPGFGGQKLIPACLDKVSDTRKLLDSKGFKNVEIEVDGNVSFDNIKELKNRGANIFVGGTASIFFKGNTLEENIRLTKEVLFK